MVNKKMVCAVLCALLTASTVGCKANNAKGQASSDPGMSAGNIQLIELEEAKSTALQHAGLSENDVVFVETKLERDNGRDEYDIEFTSNNVKYEYEIDAGSGNVLGFSSKSISENRSDTEASLSGEGSEQITVDEAKAIALEHAGFAADQVVFTKSELDYDNGTAEYEIEFKANGLEYEYEINASTGKIIKFDTDD